MSNERYTIIVSGETLVLTRDQIESDPGNYFSTFFFGDFAEGVRGVREIAVEKEPLLFKLIQAHLRGYEVLPLRDSFIPRYMTKAVALRNLLREAQFYGLQKLEEKIKEVYPELSDEVVHTSTLHPISAAKTYKFAQFRARWVINDITSEGHELILSRLANAPQKQLRAYKSLRCPGYKLVVGWSDGPKDGNCALLVSNPPYQAEGA